MDIHVYTLADAAAVEVFASKLAANDDGAHFVAIQSNVDLPIGPLQAAARTADLSLFGTTSCLGAMSQDGVTQGAVAFVITDADGDYGVGRQTFGDDPKRAARVATKAALSQADRPGEVPDLIWVSATPGCEEAVLSGIEDIVGSTTPIIGGSAADNSVEGHWYVYDAAGDDSAGLVVAALFPSTPLSFAYQSGYAPTDAEGTVTKATGRQIIEIDGRPAADVYADWTGGVIPSADPDEAVTTILADSTPWPLGRQTHTVGGVPFFLLAHPSGVDESGALHLFADVAEGERLVQMSGSVDALTQRAGRVATMAADAGDLPVSDIAGALVVYCGGCMLYVRDKLDHVVGGLTTAMPDVPFAGLFTFGEQGPIVNGGNRHGNLMISCVVFGK